MVIRLTTANPGSIIQPALEGSTSDCKVPFHAANSQTISTLSGPNLLDTV